MLPMCLTVCPEEKYPVASFKTARALKNKLQACGVLSAWENFFSENADLLSQDMPKHDTILMNMNSWATTLETRFSGQDVEALGAVLMELTKM